MNKQQKQEQVNEFGTKLREAQAAFLVDYRGLNVEEVNDLRRKLRDIGVEYRVVKNTLLRIAIQDTGMKCLDPYLEGPTAIAIAHEEPVSSAKVLADFAKDKKKFELKVGCVQGQLYSVDDIQRLSQLPSREVLLGKILGSLNAPASNLVGVLAAVPRSLVQVLAAIQEKKEH